MFFFDFRGFWFWKILKIQKTQCVVFGFFRFLLKNPKKTLICSDFPWFSSKNPKKTYCFFLDFQSFCFWKFLKNHKKPIVVFGFSVVLIEKSKKIMLFFGFFNKNRKNPKTSHCGFWIFKISKTKNLENPKKPLVFWRNPKNTKKHSVNPKNPKLLGHTYSFWIFWIFGFWNLGTCPYSIPYEI